MSVLLSASAFCGASLFWGEFLASAQAADPQPYSVKIVPTGQADLDSMMQASSMLASLQKTAAVGPYALAGRIRSDYDRISNALESQGYYAGTVTIRVSLPGGSVEGRDPALPDRLSAVPAKKSVSITISASKGPLFHLGHISLVSGPLSGETDKPKSTPDASQASQASQASPSSAPPQNGAKQGGAASGKAGDTASPKPKPAAPPPAPIVLNTEHFGLESGQPAIASDVLAAQSRLLSTLQEEGHALANVSTPVAYLRPQTHTLDIEFHVGIGPVVDIGPVSFTGQKRTRLSYLRRRVMVHEGELYQPSKIESARQDLAAVGVFSSVGVNDAPPLVQMAQGQGTPGVTQAMPLNFTFKEAKRRTVSAQIGYSTDLGGRVGASWTHHNLLGGAEQLRLTALITGLGGSAQQGLGYDVYADFLKPDFLRRNQNLSLRVEGIRQLLYSYHQTALLVRGGIIRRLNRHWSIAGSLSVEQEAIRQFGDTRNYFIASIPLSATFDNTDLSNPIDPATHGMRANVNITPSESLENGSSFFTVMSGSVSTYFDLHRIGLSRPGRSVIAVRGLVGSVQGASTYQIPPDQRLYAGGPATVRGFRYQGVGPQYGKYGIGGTSLDAGSVEYRQRILKSFGAAAFVDAGQVGAGSRPFQGTLRVGYGAGVRYYTPIGPVRLDVALPVNRPPHGDRWELYIGLGETF
ncbi:hypothetical protein A0U90_03240 [Kozakia baliensis]|nr:hypothetical protein A0U90_03240 [Kozakia baliensis]